MVRHGSRVGAWNAMPAILTGLLTTCARDLTVPLNGNCRPVASFIRVDLPQPDGPTTAANSPSSTAIDRPSTASVPVGAAVGVAHPLERDERGHGAPPQVARQFALRSAAGGRNEASKMSAAFGLPFLNS